MYLRHGFRRPNSAPKFGASVIGIGPYGTKRKPAATTRAALSEAESAEREAGQIQSLPDDLRVQHGAEGSEVSAKPRPCSRRGCIDWAERFRAASRCAGGRSAPVTAQRQAFFLLTAPPPFSFCRLQKENGGGKLPGFPGTPGRSTGPRRRGAPRVWLPPAKFRNGIWGVSHGHPALRVQHRQCAATGRRVVGPYGGATGGAESTNRNIARRFYEKESKSLTLHHGPRGLG